MKVRKLIASLMVLIFAFVCLPTIFIQSLTSTYLNPTFYEGPVLTKSYDFLVSFLVKEIEKQEDVSQYIKPADIKELITTYFPKSTFKEIAQDFISQIKNINKRGVDEINVSLMPLKENIEDLSQETAHRIISEIPVCSSFNEEDLINFNKNEIPSCIPPQVEPLEIENSLAKQLKREFNEKIPDKFSPVLQRSTQEFEQEINWHQIFSIFEYIHLILPLFLLILLLLIMLIIYKPYTTIMKFIGSAFLLGGIFGLIGGQIFAQIPILLNDLFIENEKFELYDFLFSFIVRKMTIYSLFFAGIGLVMIIFAIFMHKRKLI
jgi:hypothetical protein